MNANRLDKPLRVLQFVARLKRPFGALLLIPSRRNAGEYRRVAAESLITAQLPGELTPGYIGDARTRRADVGCALMVSRALFTACCLDRVRVLLYAIYTFLDLNNLLPLNNGVELLPFWRVTPDLALRC